MSTRNRRLICRNRQCCDGARLYSLRSRSDDHLQILVIVEHQHYALRGSHYNMRRHSHECGSAEVSLSSLGECLSVQFLEPCPTYDFPGRAWCIGIGLV